MKTKSEWVPTKYEWCGTSWRAERASAGGVVSRLMGDLQAAHYERALRAYAKGKLADLGCGDAPLTGIYRDIVDDYVWADWANSPFGDYEVDLKIDLNRALPFSDGELDTILLSDVLEHIACPDRLFAEMVRSLNREGHIIIGVPFLYWIHGDPYDFQRYTRYKLEHFGILNNVDVIEVKEIGGAFDALTDISCKLLGAAWQPLARLPYHAWLILSFLPFIRLVNEKSAKRFPLGYLAVYRKR